MPRRPKLLAPAPHLRLNEVDEFGSRPASETCELMPDSRSHGVTVAVPTKLLLALKGVSPGTSYGMPSFMLHQKFFARFRDDDTVLVLQLGSIDDRDVLMQMDPEAYFFTDHYKNYPAVLVRLAEITGPQLLQVAWEDLSMKRAPKRKRPRNT